MTPSMLSEKWQKVLNNLESQVTAITFDLWVKTLTPLDVVDNILYLVATSTDAKNRCLKLCEMELKLAIVDNFNEISDYKILSPEESELFKKKLMESGVINNDSKNSEEYKFNEKYTFNNFVVGKSNQYVYFACKSVAENPSGQFNPLFIYGGVGLGKTHLMHAIGNFIRKNNPQAKVGYVTCEKFTNDYIASIGKQNKDKSISEFREKYRNLDVLLVDDIQFITNKTETQEEFFHTFNDLYQNNKQIVIASDRHPKNIATLSDRLQSRFSSGLIQDIQSPDFETRVAILRKKAAEENYNVEYDVINYIAEKVDTNIREMEGYLAKVTFYANLSGKHFANMDDCIAALKDNITQEKDVLSPEKIMDVVCNFYHVTKSELIGKKRNKELVEPRQMCIYLMSDLLTIPLTSIGEIMGGRDHTTVIHSRDKVAELIKTDNKTRIIASDLRDLISPR